MSVSPLPRQHAHTSLGAPNSSLRTRIPKATVAHRSPSRAGGKKEPGVQLIRSRSTSPRPAPLAYNSPPVRNRESIVASEDSYGQTIFLNVSNIIFSPLFNQSPISVFSACLRVCRTCRAHRLGRIYHRRRTTHSSTSPLSPLIPCHTPALSRNNASR
jgi:hypothetical protein